jgi:thioredoxin-dependent peroxiredoxin
MLTEGVKVPNIAVTDDTGNDVTLEDFAGKTLVLWFYPKDDTPG